MTIDQVLMYYDYAMEHYIEDHTAGSDKNSPDKHGFYQKYGDTIKRGT